MYGRHHAATLFGGQHHGLVCPRTRSAAVPPWWVTNVTSCPSSRHPAGPPRRANGGGVQPRWGVNVLGYEAAVSGAPSGASPTALGRCSSGNHFGSAVTFCREQQRSTQLAGTSRTIQPSDHPWPRLSAGPGWEAWLSPRGWSTSASPGVLRRRLRTRRVRPTWTAATARPNGDCSRRPCCTADRAAWCVAGSRFPAPCGRLF